MSKGGQYFECHQKVFPLDLRYLKSLVGFFGGVDFWGVLSCGNISHSQYGQRPRHFYGNHRREIIHALDRLLPAYFKGMISLTTGEQESCDHIHLSPTAAQAHVHSGAGCAVCLPE